MYPRVFQGNYMLHKSAKLRRSNNFCSWILWSQGLFCVLWCVILVQMSVLTRGEYLVLDIIYAFFKLWTTIYLCVNTWEPEMSVYMQRCIPIPYTTLVYGQVDAYISISLSPPLLPSPSRVLLCYCGIRGGHSIGKVHRSYSPQFLGTLSMGTVW